ncbi:MAG: UDP-GlcNAc:undecaprenyl-phosphate GlcNAc-1-phosphate transferase [Parasphingorhabdus sp.]|jgi:UDP-GlcNAc:undecaprenyl-phosphate GlcNAc-1-phosphate transferase|uniref:glycosyltransferase family 4 protein n=1 Tax=Parasphingorhabdus sp. TaxID=2709688 RepID=UPI001B59D930|nr:undecaprenyl/decaprenyl-phosphate alpha-N-acetylglucosaminyl 1-phosphate transferase [Sphingomonadales bacterium]|tara:strand:+ start:4255 stop:5277 length:1023 start_codon:yes stop_codon:yes gene_type:complete
MTLNIAAMVIVSFLFTVALILAGGGLAKKLGLMDVPGGRKKHMHPTPLMGGLTIILIILPLMVAYSLFFPSYFQGAILAIATVGGLIAALAIVDDRVHISPIIRLAISALFFGVAMSLVPGLQIGAITWDGGAGYISLGRYTIILTVVALIALINAVNMADGKNGLVTGLCFGYSLILLVSARSDLAPILGILVGATSALFVFNLTGKIFLGDGGSYGLAAFVGMFAIYVYQRSDILISADQVGLMFMIPVGDMARLMIARIRAGESPMKPDRNHLHHLLQERIGWRNGLFTYWGMVFLPNIVAFALPSSSWAMILLSFICYWLVFSYCKRDSKGVFTIA